MEEEKWNWTNFDDEIEKPELWRVITCYIVSFTIFLPIPIGQLFNLEVSDFFKLYIELHFKFLNWIYPKPRKKCDCNDPNCRREIKGTKEGKLYMVNHFTCGKVKKVIKDYGQR